ncbi:transcriptional regulator [Lysinibacillus sp. NPDC093712]|uniref:transcriptional regulator n=1 Tax=Lysinibacillus sp. NPDC093712 TaxID=3390579 RepID=UPI003D07F3BA
MRKQLIKAIIYAKTGAVIIKRVKIIKVVGDLFQAFYFAIQAKRIFLISIVLAVIPVFRKGRGVV